MHVVQAYCKVASSNTSRLEAYAGFFRLLMKGIFDPDVLWPFDQKLIFELVALINTRDYTVKKELLGDSKKGPQTNNTCNFAT